MACNNRTRVNVSSSLTNKKRGKEKGKKKWGRQKKRPEYVRSDAFCFAILAKSGFPDDALNIVSILECRSQRLEHNGRYALAASVPIGPGIPHARAAVGGEHVEGTERDEALGVHDQVGAGRDGDAGVARPELLHGLVQGDEAGAARRIDGHGWAMPVEKVGDAVGEDGVRGARGVVGAQAVVAVAHHDLVVVGHHLARVHGRVRAAQGLHREARGLHGLVDGLEQQTALRVQTQGLGGTHAEEGGVEAPVGALLGEEVGLLDVEVAMVLAALVVVARTAESVNGDGLGQLARAPEQVPELRGRVGVSREAAATPDDGDISV